MNQCPLCGVNEGEHHEKGCALRATTDAEIEGFLSQSLYQKPRWRWYIFGVYHGPNGHCLMRVDTVDDVPLWHRILTRIFLRSKWERLT